MTSAPGSADATGAAVAGRAGAVSFRSVGRSFAVAGGEARTVLRDVSLDVAPGEIVAILGASGCGKSTLLRIAGGLDGPDAGSVLIDGEIVSAFDRRCAIGFQEPRLLPWRSLSANVALGLARGTSRAEGRATVERLLGLVGLADFAGHRPREISGGMAQRASLARALARNPGVLLLDEPFGAIDALTRLRMQDLLLDVHAAAPTTILLVTHDVDEALQLADRIVILGRGGGLPGADVRELVVVPGERPRDRASADLADLRGHLLAALGVDPHRQSGTSNNRTAPAA